MKTRFLFQLVMLVALSVFAFAVPALAEDAAASSMGILSLLEGMLPESALTWVTFAVTLCAAMAVAMGRRLKIAIINNDIKRRADLRAIVLCFLSGTVDMDGMDWPLSSEWRCGMILASRSKRNRAELMHRFSESSRRCAYAAAGRVVGC